MDAKIFETYESQVRSYCRNFPAVFKTAKGSVIYDGVGKRYIDFFAGAGALNYGHNHPYIKEKLIEYLRDDGIMHALDMYTEAKAEFIEKFNAEILTPRALDYKYMFTGPTGTNAVEAALKLARKVKNRSEVIAFMGAFHGMTLASLALTTDQTSREGAGVPLNNVTHIPTPYMIGEQQAIDYLKMILSDDHSGLDKPAAMVIETTQAEGGIHVFSNSYLKAIERICRENDMLLIVDDIQVGCGRTGDYFSFERAGINPDMVVLSKSIGGLGLPMALLLIKPPYDIWRPAEHNGTFRGNQLAFVAAGAALDVLKQENVLAEVARKAKITEAFIYTEILPLHAKLTSRGIGLSYGVDFIGLDNTGAFAKKVLDICFEHGLIIERVGRQNAVLKIMPPLVIEDDILLDGLRILRDAIQAALKG